MESKKYSLNKADVESIAKGALVALSGAVLTYFSSVVTDTDLGTSTPIVVAAWSVVANAIRKYLADGR